MSKEFQILTPGPVPLSPETLEILGEQVWHHRIPEFEKLLLSTLDMLKKLFGCSQGHAFAITSTGSGGLESALVNVLSPGDHVLCIASGKFGHRWADIAEHFGLVVDRLEVEWGKAVTADLIRQHFDSSRHKALLSQICETSTGVLHPVETFRECIGPAPLLILDGITAVGAVPLSMDQLGADVVVGGSQKAFALPTGMSFLGMSKKALDTFEEAQCQRFYFDLRPELKANQKGQTRFSSPTGFFRGLEHNLKTLLANPDAHFARIQELSDKTALATTLLGFPQFAESPSPSLTAIDLAGKFDSSQIRAKLECDHGITIMGGQDHLKGRILRIGHMGHIQNKDMLLFFDKLIETLNNEIAGFISPTTRTKVLGTFS